MRTIIVGLGNPILGDDGVGWKVVEAAADRIENSRPENGSPLPDFEQLGLGGLSLMERLIGYDRAILVDAITTGQHPVGTVYWFNLDALPARSTTGHTTSAHDATLTEAFAMGRAMGASLPQEVMIVGIEAEITYDFSDQLSPPVAAAVPEAVDTLFELLTMPPNQS